MIKSESTIGQYNGLRLLPYVFGLHINVLIYFVYVEYGSGRQFEEDGSLNHDVMISFPLHKQP